MQKLREGSWADLDGDEQLAKARARRVRSRAARSEAAQSMEAAQSALQGEDVADGSEARTSAAWGRMEGRARGHQPGRLLRCVVRDPATGRKCGATAASLAEVRRSRVT